MQREASASLRAVALWRVAFALATLVVDLAAVPLTFFGAFHSFAEELQAVCFVFEASHARRYYALTGFDPARAAGDENRYREARVLAGEESRDGEPE